MAQKNVNQETDERLGNVEEALSTTEKWIEDNQKTLWIILIAVLVVAFGIYGISRYNKKRDEAASAQIFKAQQYLETEKYDEALNGDGNSLGFLDIISDYGSTKTGKLAAYSAGICYMKQGNYEEAINYLKKYNNKDQVLAAMALGCIGDCYMELDDLQNAVTYYGKAAAKNANEFTSPIFLMKEGMTYEMLGDFAKAMNAYQTIKKDFPNSNEAFEIGKYISNCEEKLK